MLKNNKGITLISLIIYILVVTIVLSILTVVFSNFDKNKDLAEDKGKYIAELDKMALYFIRDSKNNLDANVEVDRVVFADGTNYKYEKEEKSIYRNKVKIAQNIEYCTFLRQKISSGGVNKIMITVDIIPSGYEINRRITDYILKYW